MDQGGNSACYGIEELARLGGVSRRTVRYYVQRGLLPAPTGTGRGDHYTPVHLDTLIRIRQLQEQGVPLEQIPQRLAAPLVSPFSAPPLSPVLPPSLGEPIRFRQAERPAVGDPWLRLRVADGVELHLSAAGAARQEELPGGVEGLTEALRQLVARGTGS